MGTRLQLLGLALLASLEVVLPVAPAGARGRPPLTWQDRQRNLESFDYIWTTIRDKHWDPKMGGLDWEAVRDELRPRIEKTTSMAEAREIMSDMISRLDMSHFAIIPAKVYNTLDEPCRTEPYDGAPGLEVRVVDGVVLVVSVEEGSPAAEVGVRPGWEVLRVGDKDLAARIEVIAKEFEGKSWKDGILSMAANRHLRGPVGGTLSAEFLDGRRRVVELEVPLARQRGRVYKVGHLPPMHVWIEVRRVGGDIGYLAFNHFLDPLRLMPAFNEGMKSFMSAEGIIIDLRGNGGGIAAMALGMVGWLVESKGIHLGTLYTRETELKLVVTPRLETYEGPVAVLVDEMSGSAAEFFSGGLKDIGRARIFGRTTAGAALPSAIEMLPNGDGFQYVVGNYITAGGVRLEGVGVIPHVEVRPTREDLLEGRDPALEAAIAWIRGERGERRLYRQTPDTGE